MKNKLLLIAIFIISLSVIMSIVGEERLALFGLYLKNGSSFEFDNKKYEISAYVIITEFAENEGVALSSLEIYESQPIFLRFRSPIGSIKRAVDANILSIEENFLGSCTLYQFEIESMANEKLLVNHNLQLFYRLNQDIASNIDIQELCTAVSVA